MKEYKTQTPENTYTVTKAEIAVIHALCYYCPDGMTDAADKIRTKLEEQFRMHDAIGEFKVWKE